MTSKNPFPGMNPYFEQRWRDAHASLITYLGDALQERLPADLVAQTEEEVVTIGAGGAAVTYRPDVQVQQPWILKEPDATETTALTPPDTATEPIRVLLDDEVERSIQIRDLNGRLITVLELLSPTNKIESADRDRFCRKRNLIIRSGVNLVEIDLVRQGAWVFPEGIRKVLRQADATYGVCVARAGHRGEYEVYPIPLRERLPNIRVPLRPADAEVLSNLQALIDQCHERRRYYMLDYRLPLDPPLPPQDAAWAQQRLQQHQLT